MGTDRGFLAKKATPEPPSASHWPEPKPELSKPKVTVKPGLPATQSTIIHDEDPAPLPTPTHPDAEGPLRTQEVPGEPVRG